MTGSNCPRCGSTDPEVRLRGVDRFPCPDSWHNTPDRPTHDVNAPIPMRLPCPSCGALHVDVGEFATRPHHTHACQACGNCWRPAVVATVGVRFLPGFQNDFDGEPEYPPAPYPTSPEP